MKSAIVVISVFTAMAFPAFPNIYVTPDGTYNENIMSAIRESGHLYARTVLNMDVPFPPEDSMAFHPNCHFLVPGFLERYVNAKASHVFYLWGHSYEIISGSMWQDFEDKIKYISDDPESQWADVIDLFALVE